MKSNPKLVTGSKLFYAAKMGILIVFAVICLSFTAMIGRVSVEALQARTYATEQISEYKSNPNWIQYPKTNQKIREAALIVEGPLTEPLRHDWFVTSATWLLYGGSEPTRIVNNAARIATEGRHARTIWEMVGRIAVIRMLLADPETAFEIFYNQTYLRFTIGGQDVRGFDKGAEYYLHKSSSELSWSEAALLLAIANSPSDYDPNSFPDRAKSRRNWILDQLEKAGKLGATEVERYKAEPLITAREN